MPVRAFSAGPPDRAFVPSFLRSSDELTLMQRTDGPPSKMIFCAFPPMWASKRAPCLLNYLGSRDKNVFFGLGISLREVSTLLFRLLYNAQDRCILSRGHNLVSLTWITSCIASCGVLSGKSSFLLRLLLISAIYDHPSYGRPVASFSEIRSRCLAPSLLPLPSPTLAVSGCPPQWGKPWPLLRSCTGAVAPLFFLFPGSLPADSCPPRPETLNRFIPFVSSPSPFPDAVW